MEIYSEFRRYAMLDRGIGSSLMDSYEKTVMKSNYDFTNLTPNIVEERDMNVAILDVFSRLMKDRIIFLGTGINDQVANIIIAQLLFLSSADKNKNISLYVNSPGGSVYAGLGIYDTMQYVDPIVSTMTVGMAASMGYVLACAGHPGYRSGLPNAKFMQHQPLGGAQGQASDILIVAREIEKTKIKLYEIISYHTGKSVEQITIDADRDHWMTAAEAKDYGVIDSVVSRNEEKFKTK